MEHFLCTNDYLLVYRECFLGEHFLGTMENFLGARQYFLSLYLCNINRMCIFGARECFLHAMERFIGASHSLRASFRCQEVLLCVKMCFRGGRRHFGVLGSISLGLGMVSWVIQKVFCIKASHSLLICYISS